MFKVKPSSQQIVDDIFTCYICLCLVKKAVACGNCDKLTCEACIDMSLLKNRSCPHCQKPHSKSKLNLLLKSQLNDCEFSCLKCGLISKYENMQAHIENCPSVVVVCPLSWSCNFGSNFIGL